MIDPATQAITRELPVEDAIQVIPNSVKHQLYVARGMEGLDVLDAGAGGVIEHFLGNIVSIAFNPRTNKLYASNEQSSAVQVYDTNTFQLIETIGVDNPGQIEADPNTNRIYVLADSSSYRGVGVIDGSTDAYLYAIGEQFYASAFALDLVHNRLFIIVSSEERIYSYDLYSEDLIEVGQLNYNYADAVAYNPNNNAVYVAYGNNSDIEVLNGNGLSQVDVIAAPNNVYALAIDVRSNTLYAGGQNDIFVYNIDSTAFEEPVGLAYGKTVGKITVAECSGSGMMGPTGATGPQGLTGPAGPGSCDPNEVLISDTEGSIFLIDAASGSVNTTIPTGNTNLTQWTVAANRANRSIYVVENNSLVQVYSADDGSLTDTVNIFPQDLASIATDPCQNLWYAASAGTNSVYVLEGSSNRMLKTILLEGDEFQIGPPTSLFPVPCQKKLLLFYDRNVAIIDLEHGVLERALTLSETAVPYAYDTNSCVVYASSYGNVFAINPASGAVSSIPVGNVDFSMIAFNARLNVLYSIGYESLAMTNVFNNEQLLLESASNTQGLVFDPQTNRPILIANDSMQILDPATLQPISTHPIVSPGYISSVSLINGCGCNCNYCLAGSSGGGADCDHMAYVVNGYEMKIINQSTGLVTNTVNLSYYGYAGAYSPVNPAAHNTSEGVVLVASDNGVMVLDALTGEDIDLFAPGNNFQAIAYNPASNLIFAATQSHVYSFEPVNFTELESIMMTGGHNGIPILVQDPTYPYVFATDGTTGTISVWDGTSPASQSMSSSYSITQLALDTKQRILYVYSTANNTLRGLSYRPETFNDILTDTSIPQQPDRMEFNETTGLIYLNSLGAYPRVLMAVYPEYGSEAFFEEFFSDIHALSIDNTTNRIFYSSDNQLYVLDGTSRVMVNEISDVEAIDITFATLNCGGSSGDSLGYPQSSQSANAIPLADIQIAVNEDGERWLRAKIHGSPQPGDRLYLRRLSRSGPKKGSKHYSIRHMAHPQNPLGEAGGSLPKHLNNTAYFSGGNYWRKRAERKHADDTCPCAPQPADEYYRTEWALNTPDQTIWLMPLDDFLGLFHGRRLAAGGNRQYYFAIDFVVARPDPNRQHASYGPPSKLLRIYRKNGERWGVSFI